MERVNLNEGKLNGMINLLNKYYIKKKNCFHYTFYHKEFDLVQTWWQQHPRR